ncbi:MAG TPA: amino acid ABC transporter substrate-binding protein [Anaerovoracaceae bacterium]|nr:amino acid ABC transporter substrate-binding protein [Anaerovoracaceae bacterium]
MKKTKGILILILTLIMALSLFGCAGSSDSDQEEAPATVGLLEEIQEKGTLTIGIEGTYPPYTYHDEISDELAGYDVEIAQAIAQKLGVEAEFVETKWDSIIAGLDADRYDVIINQVGITAERQEKYDFSQPYTYTKGVLIVAEDNNEITSFEDLDGKKSAQTVTSNWAATAESYGATIEGTDGFSQSIELVLSGRADATLNDDVTFYDYKKAKPDAKVKFVATSDEISVSGVMIRKGNEEFLNAINTALDELRAEGKLKEISQKYFGVDVSAE